jgi:hypothetical protein
MWLLAARCTTVRSINVTLTLSSFGYSKVFLKEVLGLAAIKLTSFDKAINILTQQKLAVAIYFTFRTPQFESLF